MKRGPKIAFAGVAVAAIAGLTAAGWFMGKAMPVGAGFVAKYICSSVFISHRDPAKVYTEDIAPINPLARLVDYRIDRAGQAVHADAWGFFPMTAIYREGCGCSLVVGTTEARMRAQHLVPPDFSRHRRVHAQDLPWPAGAQGIVEPTPAGIDTQRLQKALDDAFSEPGAQAERRTRAVVIVHEGRLIAERYADGFDRDTALLGWSMAKSVTNAAVGILVQDGRLDIRQPAPVVEWQTPGDPRRAITLDQLLRMSSGLAFAEVYAPLQDATDMLYGSYDFAAFAAGKALAGRPDTLWNYASGTANLVARIVRQTVAEDHPYYYSFFYERLFDKIGMTSAVMEPDASGTFVGSSYVFATARDWARFGLLYLQDGVWNGERILPAGWVAYTTTPAPAAPSGQYGAFFWLNAGSAHDPGGRRWPDAPPDAFAAEGFQGQRVIVIASRKLVLVRFGATSNRSAWDTNRFIRDVLEAMPGTALRRVREKVER